MHTVSYSWYTFTNIVTGVVFGLAQPSFERTFTHLLAWSWYAAYSAAAYVLRLHRKRVHVPSERTPLLSVEQRTTDSEGSLASGSSERQPTQQSGSVNDSEISERSGLESWQAWSTWSKQLRTEFSDGLGTLESWTSASLRVISVCIIIAWAVAGSFVSVMPIDNAGLLASDTCGLWGLKDDANDAAQDKVALTRGRMEARAGQYARDCYPPQSTASVNQCSVFKYPLIPTFEFNRNQACPFVNETYCDDTGYTAVRFSTGLVDATRIGINTSKPPKFNRTSICVPLNLRDRDQGGPEFVERGSEAWRWRYDLGPVGGPEDPSEYTFYQYWDPFDSDVRSYTMR